MPSFRQVHLGRDLETKVEGGKEREVEHIPVVRESPKKRIRGIGEVY